MSEKAKRAVVICPGRGTYGKDHLSSLNTTEDLKLLDQWRKEDGYPSLTELDQAPDYKVSLHTKGEHASPLIYACALQDFKKISDEKMEIVAVTGNSMGWYLALAMTEALSPKDSYRLIQDMGALMSAKQSGGQVLYPVIDEDWCASQELEQLISDTIKEARSQGHQAHLSIHLGGYRVLAGDRGAISFFMKKLPKKDPYPLQLVNHGAYHCPIMSEISKEALQKMLFLNWQKPRYPLIDGRGAIWQPHSTCLSDLHQYTLGHQVTETYDYSQAIRVALKEFAPDHLILLGPGDNLGGATAQILIEQNWLNLKTKAEFQECQKQSPYVLAMARPEQASLCET